jgi:hypothetical protein
VRIIKTETKVFGFDELTDEGKKWAVERLFDLNVDYDWWDMTYDDAETVGIKITSFCIDRGAYCEGDFQLSSHEVAANIILEHGVHCETNKTAQIFLDGVNSVEPTEGEEYGEGEEYEDKMMELDEEFKKSILEDYRIILQKEYEYRTTEEAIIETIKANDYEFTAEGSIY